ncbi:MAG: BACON domain-containing protein, partial [Ktedonobacteraceae bacterium]
MRVIRCPNCDEPLPGFANFCAGCGETLTPAPTSSTVKVSDRPRALKVPHFFSLENYGDVSVATDSSTETVKFFRRSSRSSLNSSIAVAQASLDPAEIIDDDSSDDSETRRNKNWHKIVDSRPMRTPSLPRIPVSTPRTPAPLPLPSEYLLTQTTQRKPRLAPPALFFWVSMVLLVAIVGGGLFGVVVTLGRGILAQTPPQHNELALQVTPSSVALGAIITVRGNNFSPRGKVGLTRDSAIPVMDTGNNTIIQADNKGSFTDTIIVEPEWQAGSHILRAEDAHLHKITAFTILVTGHSPSLRPAYLLLSTNSLDLGSGDQATNSTKTITLTNAGGGQISWQTATTQPWLLLTPKSGSFST